MSQKRRAARAADEHEETPRRRRAVTLDHGQAQGHTKQIRLPLGVWHEW